MSLTFDVVAVVVCDEVRREETGKDIIIGAYSGGIKVDRLPAFISLSVYMELHPHRAGEHDVTVKLVGPGGAILFDLPNKAGKLLSTLSNFSFILNGMPISLQAEGDIVIQISADGAEWQTIKTIRVEKGAIPVRP